MNYDIQFIDSKGEAHTKYFEGFNNPGEAFAECLKKNPNCRLLRAQAHSKVCGNELWIDYYPPKVQRDPSFVKRKKPEAQEELKLNL